jgi:phage baseplate assembly protein W
MDTGPILGRGLAFPPRLVDGRMAWSAGEESIRDCIRLALETEPSERVMLPAFGGGLGRFLFEPNTVQVRGQLRERIERTLSEWEPRIAVESVEVEADPADAGTAVATITYRLVATQARHRLGLSVALGG